jgi:hypothetical protein
MIGATLLKRVFPGNRGVIERIRPDQAASM